MGKKNKKGYTYCFVKIFMALWILQKQAKELEAEWDSIVIEEEETVKDYYDFLQ